MCQKANIQLSVAVHERAAGCKEFAKEATLSHKIEGRRLSALEKHDVSFVLI